MDLTGLIGVPYAGDRGCAVFAAQVLARHGIPYPLEVNDPVEATGWVRADAPRALDVVVFTRAGRCSHVGVCIGNGQFLHVEEGSTSRKERLSSPLWARRIEGFYRYLR